MKTLYKRISAAWFLRFGLAVVLLLFFMPAAADAQVEIKDDRIFFGKEIIEFGDLAEAVVEFCKVNVIIPDKVKSKSKLYILTPEGLGREETWKYFMWFLETMEVSFTTVGSQKVMAPSRDIGRLPSSVYIKSFPPLDKKQPPITLLYRLKALDAETMQKVLDPLRSKYGKIFAYDNLLIIIEMQNKMSRLVKIIKELDVEAPASKIFYWSAVNSPIDDIVEITEQLFMKGGRGKETAVGLEKIVTDERTNGMFILGTEDACLRVLAFVPKLDLSLDRVSRMEVVFLKFAEAEKLNSTLTSIVSRSRGKKSRKREFGDELEVQITADKSNNALILQGPPRGIAEIKRIIKKLDLFPKQVFLELVVLEVALTDMVATGISMSVTRKIGGQTFTAATTSGGTSSIAPDPTSLMGLALGLRGKDIEGTGAAYGLSNDLPSFSMLIRMLQINSNVNIVSNPYLMAMDAEEAEVIVGSNVPFVTGTARDSYNQPVLSIQRQDVALSIKLKPEINEKNRVKLKIDVNVEDMAAMSEVLGPTTSKRAIKTTAVTGNGARVAIGGLMKNKEIADVEKVPVLGDIPIMGRLFRTESERKEKINLMVVITPHILESPEDVRRIFKKKLKERREYIRELYGREDLEYDVAKDYHDRVGIVETIRKVIHEEKLAAEAEDGERVLVITPDGVDSLSKEEAGDLEKDTDGAQIHEP